MSDKNKAEEQVNHFKIWEITAPALDRKISFELSDQFDDIESDGKTRGKLKAATKELKWLANPVAKEKDGKPHGILKDTDQFHLTGWKLIDQSDKTPREVQIFNQFTTEKGEKWKLGEAQYLLVPAAKSEKEQGLPEKKDFEKHYADKNDHYLCYEVKGGKKFNQGLILKDDQIDKKIGTDENIRGLTPKFLAVPVQKTKPTVGGPSPKILHEHAHLAIYELDPPKPAGLQYSTLDQFDKTKNFGVDKSRYLAVPSEKTIISDEKKAPR